MGSYAVAAEPVASPFGVVAECDVADGIPAIASPRAGARALVLVRVFSEPVGMMARLLPAGGMCADDLAAAIVCEFGPQLRERFAECGLTWDGQLPAGGLHPPHTPRFLASRERVMREGPQMTIAVCTRGRPEGLAVLLETLSAQEYRRIRVLVVDNAPSDDCARRVVLAAARERSTSTT